MPKFIKGLFYKECEAISMSGNYRCIYVTPKGGAVLQHVKYKNEKFCYLSERNMLTKVTVRGGPNERRK